MNSYRTGVSSSLLWPIRGALAGVIVATAFVYWSGLSGGNAIALFANAVAWSLPAGFTGFLIGCLVPESLGQSRRTRR